MCLYIAKNVGDSRLAGPGQPRRLTGCKPFLMQRCVADGRGLNSVALCARVVLRYMFVYFRLTHSFAFQKMPERHGLSLWHAGLASAAA